MTPTQLRIAVTVEKLGSISNAARELGISQPNASNGLRLLEKEIGFPVFIRTAAGAAVTEKGRAFLCRARRILSENDEIMKIQSHAEAYRLRIGAVNYLSAAEPFLTLCGRHRDDAEADFRFLNVSVEEGIRALDKYELDLVFAPMLKSQRAGAANACGARELTMLSLGAIPAVISVRKDHPAIRDGRCTQITQGSDAMKDYPYAAYRNLTENSGATSYNDEFFAQSSYVIYVDEVVTRLRLVASSNAFCFGIVPSKGVNERYGLVSFPVPGMALEAFCLVRRGEEDRKEIQEYITLLKKELEPVMSGQETADESGAGAKKR